VYNHPVKENKLTIQEPTSEQCDSNDKVLESDDKIGYAIWYPQMGGYSGKAVAVMDKRWEESHDAQSRFGGCIDIFVWHDGMFPFGDGNPRHIHICDPEQFIDFGEKLNKLNLANREVS